MGELLPHKIPHFDLTRFAFQEKKTLKWSNKNSKDLISSRNTAIIRNYPCGFLFMYLDFFTHFFSIFFANLTSKYYFSFKYRRQKGHVLVLFYRVFIFQKFSGDNGAFARGSVDGRGDGDDHEGGADRRRLQRNPPSHRLPPLKSNATTFLISISFLCILKVKVGQKGSTHV